METVKTPTPSRNRTIVPYRNITMYPNLDSNIRTIPKCTTHLIRFDPLIMFKIYRIQLPDGKNYIGQTKRSLEKRIDKGRGYRKNEPLYNAIMRYGFENCTVSLIAECETSTEADELERLMIAYYDSTDPQKGYNRESGGVAGYKVGADTLAKFRATKSHYVMPEEYRLRRSLALKGRPLTEEHKARIAKGRMRPVEMLNEKGEVIATFASGEIAGAITGVNISSLSECCHHKRQTAGGYKWQFKEKEQ